MTMNFGFKKRNKLTYFVLLSHNEIRELFFQFLWNQVNPSYFYDGLDNSEKDITNIDHISFHKDGAIHYRISNSSRKSDKIFDKRLKNTIAAMPQDTYLPLLIFSIYDVEELRKHIGKLTPRTYVNFSNASYHWELEDTNQFSLVFFLIGADVNHIVMLQKHFPAIFNIKASPLLMNYFGDDDKVEIKNGEVTKVNDLGLLIGYTENVIPRPPSEALVGSKRKKSVERIETMFGLTLTPTDDMIMRRLGSFPQSGSTSSR